MLPSSHRVAKVLFEEACLLLRDVDHTAVLDGRGLDDPAQPHARLVAGEAFEAYVVSFVRERSSMMRGSGAG